MFRDINKNFYEEWKIKCLIMLMTAVLLLTPVVSAYQTYLTSFNSKYGTGGSSIDSCSLCHYSSSGGGALNSYGSAYSTYGHDFSSIESLDSDSDGYSNINEINARTFPGSSMSYPSGTSTYTATYTATATPTATWTSTPGTGTGSGSSFSTAILLSGSTTGTVSAGGSVFYKFYATAGQTINIVMTPAYTDLDLKFYNPSQQLFGQSATSGTVAENVMVTTSSTGYYFVEVFDYSGYGGSFTIALSGSATSTPTAYPTYTQYPTATPTYTQYPTATSTPPSTAGTIVTIQNAGGSSSMSGAANSVIPVSIVARNVQNLAAATVTLSYNPALVTVQDVSAGGIGSPTSNINNNAGTTQITVFSPTGVSGDITLANLNLKVIGSTGTAPLTLSVSALSNSNGASIPYTITSGQLTIGQILRGDMNCDGLVNIVDALLIAKFSVGLIPNPYTC